jgi:hypothetical protein
MFLEFLALGKTKMKHFHWIVFAIVAAVIAWYFFSKYKFSVPACQKGTLQIAASCQALKSYKAANPCWIPGNCG